MIKHKPHQNKNREDMLIFKIVVYYTFSNNWNFNLVVIKFDFYNHFEILETTHCR